MTIAVPWVLALMVVAPSAAFAQETSDKVVRVGWYDSSFNTMDSFGRRSGYAYEYQLKISAYTGWSYEYVTGSWSDLLQMLIEGRIDLMSDVSYTDERAETMLFPDLPMGSEEYYLFCAPGNTEISSADASTLNGKTIGVNKDSVQADFYRSWAKKNGVDAELVELNCTEAESLQMISDGTLDAYVTVDSFTDPECAAPVFKVGSSNFYFAVSKKRPELLGELNEALSRVQEENHNINQQLFERYVKSAGANAFLNAEEADWLADHGTIRVGYQDNYLAFCEEDERTHELTGALKDYLEYASDSLANATLDFDTQSYPTAEAALDALKRGEVDCVFPVSLSSYDGEQIGIVMTQPLMSTEVYAVVRQVDMNNFTNREHVVVAVDHGNLNYDSALVDHFPTWRTVYFANTGESLRAVSESVADCMLISSYRYNNLSRACERLRLTTFPTAVSLDSCIAVKKGNTELFSILEKAIDQVPASAVYAALSYYVTEDAKLTLADYLADNTLAVIAVAALIICIIVMLMVRSMRAERKAKELIAATETDGLTGLYNRDFFFQYANQMRQEQPEAPFDAIVVNIDQFHSINAYSGRDFGDQVLRVLGNEIRLVAEGCSGIAGRFGADRFDIMRPASDDFREVYDRLQGKLTAIAPNERVRLRMGVLPAQKAMAPVQMFDMARTSCNMARDSKHERLVVFDERVREREMYEQHLLNDLRKELDSYQFEVHYQPQFDILGESPTLVGAEALIRWRHPDLGMIMPDDFIHLLEQSGCIEEVDRYVCEQAARQVAGWRAEFGVTVPVSVNLSRVDVFDPMLEETIDGILKKNGLAHDAMRLEVTESVYMENADQLILVVENLRRKGYTVEMDDFGTGYSSLNMLSAIPFDVLKIDRTFIEGMEGDARTARLVELVVSVAKDLGAEVVAEGVETASQLETLIKMGCPQVQGIYLSRPLHPSDFTDAYLKDAGR